MAVDQSKRTSEDRIPIGWAPIAPDGGWGWMVVIGAFMIHVIADGIVYSFGVVVVELLDTFHEGRATTSWIISTLVGLTLSTGPLASAVTNRYGCRATTIAGALIASAGCALSWFATSVVFLMFSVGVVVGLGFGLMYCPTIIMVTMYFEERRAFATGIAVCGAGFGTFIFAPFASYLIETYTWRGAFLMYSGIVLNCVVCGALFRPLEFRPIYAEDLIESENETKTIGTIEEVGQDEEDLMSTPDHGVDSELMLDGDNLRGGVKLKGVSQTNGSHNEDRARRLYLSFNHICDSPQEQVPRANSIVGDLELQGLHKDGLRYHLHHRARRSRGVSESAGYLGIKDVFYPGSLRHVIPEAYHDSSQSHRNLDLYRSITSLHSAAAIHALAMADGAREKDSRTPQSLPGAAVEAESWWSEAKSVVYQMANLHLLENPLFLTFAISNILTSIGFNAPLILLPDKAHEQLHIAKELSAWTLSAYGIANTVGRVLVGAVSDRQLPCRFGRNAEANRLWLYNLSLVLCGFITAFSFLCTDFTSLLCFSALFGVLLSTYICLTSVILVDLLGIEHLTNAFGLLLLFQGLASFVGPPAAGYIVDRTGNFNLSFLFAGLSLAVSGLLLFAIPCIARRSKTTNNNNNNNNAI